MLMVSRVVKEFPTFYGSLPYYNTSSGFIWILFCHLWLGLTSGLFHSDFPAKPVNVFLLPPISTTFSAHVILDLVILMVFGKEYGLWSSLLCSFHRPPENSFHSGQNIFLSSLFSNALSHQSLLSLHLPDLIDF